jgi:hypothetical protein
MHASIWKFKGDPDTLLRSYDAMVAELGTASIALQLCLRAPDGIVIVDTCPTREDFESFASGEAFRQLRVRHGLPDPVEVEDFPVHVALIES